MRAGITTLGLLLLLSFAFISGAQEAACNCPNVEECNLNCTNGLSCCGAHTIENQCISPQAQQCCSWYESAAACTLTESCCGELGYGASSSAFCCGAGSSCCRTNGNGESACCGSDQICCGGYNSYCCDKGTEVCSPDGSTNCIPKNPVPTAGPNPLPGTLLWRTNVDSTATRIRKFNKTHVVVGGRGIFLVERATGTKTLVGDPSYIQGGIPVAFQNLVIVCTQNNYSQVAIDVTTNKTVWTNPNVCGHAQLRNGVVIVQGTALRARDGKTLWAAEHAFNGGATFNDDGTIVYLPTTPTQDWNAYTITARMVLTGVQVFTVNTTDKFGGAFPKPIYTFGILTVAGAISVNGTTGEPMWYYKFPLMRYLSYDAVSNTVVMTNATAIVAVDLYTGSKVWSFYSPYNSVEQGLYRSNTYNGQVYVVNGKMMLFCLNATDGKFMWNASFLGGKTVNEALETHPVAVNGVFYTTAFGSPAPQYLVALDAQSGHEMQAWEFGSGFTKFTFEQGILFTGNGDFAYGIKQLK